MEAKMISKRVRYSGIDGIRSLAATGVVLIHVLENGGYQINQFFVNILGSFWSFVCLFFIISGFSMSIGYYDKIKQGNISVNAFYSKRYAKILPFFAVMILVDCVFNWQWPITPIESFANLTLLFSFIADSAISVVGVGWTLGVIFAFYIIFPFFVFLLWDKQRAWVSLLLAYLLHLACNYYFLIEGRVVLNNLILWLCYFIMGGMLFLYKDAILDFFKNKTHRNIFTGVVVVYTIASYIYLGMGYNVGEGFFIIYVLWLLFAIITKSKLLINRGSKFIGGISYEVYLSHMAIFRVIEKLNLLHVLGRGPVAFIVTFILVFCGAVVFSFIVKKMIGLAMNRVTQTA